MPPVCSICSHPKRTEIDKALIAGETSFRNMAERFGVSTTALSRHKSAHLPGRLVKANEAKEQAASIDLMAELQRCFERVNRLFDACDAWLTDPNNAERYDIGPRADELDVTYTDTITTADGKRRAIRKKQPLSALLAEVKGERDRDFILIETKHADPRELVLKAAGRLNTQIELLAKLLGELPDGDTINVIVQPEWIALRSNILTALTPFPDAKSAVLTALTDDEVRHVA